MTEAEDRSWIGPEAELPEGRSLETFERELALVDRIIGLEAQVAQLSNESTLRPEDQLLVEDELARLRATLTWRAGRLVTAPLRAFLLAAGRPQK